MKRKERKRRKGVGAVGTKGGEDDCCGFHYFATFP